MEAEVANAVVRFQREQQGRGPTEVRANLLGDLMLVRSNGIFTPTETRLAVSDEGRRLIRSARQELRAISHLEIEEIIGGIVGARIVRSYFDIIDKGLDFTYQDAQGKFHSTGQRKSVVSINAFGLGAIDLLNEFQAVTYREDIVQSFAAKGIAVWDVSSVRDLSILIDTSFETRGQLDATFAWVQDIASPIVPVNTVFVNGHKIGF